MSSGKQVMVADDARYTPRAEGVINRSTSEAERLGSSSVGTEHLLIAILKENDSMALRLLSARGVNIQKIYVDVLSATGQDAASAKNEYLMQRSKRGGKSATLCLTSTAETLQNMQKKENLTL